MISRSIVTLSVTCVGILLGVIMTSALVPTGPPATGFLETWPEPASSTSFTDTTALSLRADRAKVQHLWGQSPENVLLYYAPVQVWNGPIPSLDPDALGIEIE